MRKAVADLADEPRTGKPLPRTLKPEHERLQRAILAKHVGLCAHEQHVAVAGSLRPRGIALLQPKAAKNEQCHYRLWEVRKPSGAGGVSQSEARLVREHA